MPLPVIDEHNYSRVPLCALAPEEPVYTRDVAGTDESSESRLTPHRFEP